MRKVYAMRKQGTCQQCGSEFEKRTAWQKFCSEDCRLAYHDITKSMAKRIGKKKRATA